MSLWTPLLVGWNALWLVLGRHECAACDEPLDEGYLHGPLCASCFAACEPVPRSLPAQHDTAPQCHSAFVYDGPLSHALQLLKWRNRDDLARPLGALLGPLLRELAAGHDWIVPVPLHPRRLRERGYNQSTLLAREALRLLTKPKPRLHPGLLLATRPTTAAHRIGRTARFERVRSLFTVPRKAEVYVRGSRMLLVDDVITTGATVTACAEALRRAGAAHVTALSLLRVVREQARPRCASGPPDHRSADALRSGSTTACTDTDPA